MMTHVEELNRIEALYRQFMMLHHPLLENDGELSNSAGAEAGGEDLDE